MWKASNFATLSYLTLLSLLIIKCQSANKAIPLPNSVLGSCAPYSVTLFMLSSVFENCEDTARVSLTRRHPDQHKNTVRGYLSWYAHKNV